MVIALLLVAAAIGSQAAVAFGYQFAPSCSCGGAYNLVANSVAQKYVTQQQQQQQQQYRYAAAPGDGSGGPPQQWQQCACDGRPQQQGVATVSGLVLAQPSGVERVGPATAIETPPPVMHNPSEFGTTTYEEEPEGGQPVCQDCGGARPTTSHIMTVPNRYRAPVQRPSQSNSVVQQLAPPQQYAPSQSNSVVQQLALPQQYGRYLTGPVYASCPAAVLYPAPTLLYTPVPAPARFGPMPPRPPPTASASAAAASAAKSTVTSSSDSGDDGLLNTFTIHSASDPVDLNSVAAAPHPPPNPRPQPQASPPSCSMPTLPGRAKPPAVKKL